MHDEVDMTQVGAPEDLTLSQLNSLIRDIRERKPNDRSELDRVYAVMLTDLEKARAYWMVMAVQVGV